jgi:hypothetical protein
VKAVAFACFVCAAFAWVPPFIDRAGLAALGLAFLALAVGAPLRGERRALPFDVPPQTVEVADDPADAFGAVDDLVSRISDWGTARSEPTRAGEP